MRLVLDTNVIVSGVLWGGNPKQLLDMAAGSQVSLFATEATYAEFLGVIAYDKFSTRLRTQGLSAAAVAVRFRELFMFVAPVAIPPTVLRDPDDDIILAAALGAKADLIVSGDADLLDLGTFRGMDIVRPVDAVALLIG